MRTKRILKSALKSLWKFKLRSFLMMIGIVIGIIALTVIVSAGFGARDLVMKRVKKFGLESLMVNAGGGVQRSQMGSSGQLTTTLKLGDADYLIDEISAIKEIAPFNRKG